MRETSKRSLFWLITLSVPFLFFFLIEAGLRLGGYQSEKQALFTEAPQTPDYLITNTRFIRRYFPSFVPEVAPNAFRKKKSPDTFRVFVFGGSSTEGFPYNFYNSFADQLEQKLLLNTQGITIEVINLGMTAVNSYVIRDLAGRILDYEPDAVLIYAGHNEFYGSFGAATTQFGFTDSIRLKHLILRLKNWRIYQVLEGLMSPGNRDSGVQQEQRTMMAKVIRESEIPLGSVLFEQGMRQFETNLEDVLTLFGDHSVPVWIGTVASNLKDQPPLTDNPEAAAAYEEAQMLYRKAEGARDGAGTGAHAVAVTGADTDAVASANAGADASDHPGAPAATQKATSSVSGTMTSADDHQKALERFEEAKELDGTRFRAPSRINSIIRELSSSYGANLVDIQELLRVNSGSGIEDSSLFIDHLHPNDKGHKLMASAFFDAITQHPEIGAKVLSPHLNINTINPPQTISTFEKAYAEVRVARLLVGYPFQKDVSVEQELEDFERIYESYLQAGYADSIGAVAAKEQVFVPEALTVLVGKARERNDTMAVVSHLYDLLKWQLRSVGLIESSIEFTLNSGEKDAYLINMLHQFINDGNVDPRYLDLLASLYLLDENTDQAAYWLKETEKVNADAPRLLYNYWRYHLLMGDTLQAARYYQRFLATQQRTR